MPDVVFEEIACKTALNRVTQPSQRMLPFRWSLNPYRGCQHACTYCFARRTHEFLGYDTGRDFESRIQVKTNIDAVLREELSRPSWRRELVAVGTACDPYQAAELKYSLTHRCLRALRDAANPCSITTKSPFVVRDADLLQELSREANVSVNISIATLDEEVWQRTEPQTARPLKRLAAMRELARRGVRTGVLLAPVLPGLTDDPASLERVIVAAKDHGAAYVWDNVLYLQPGTKEWFMPFLREAYPHLSERYAKYYRGAFAPKTYTSDVHRTVEALRHKHGMVPERERVEMRGQLALAM